MSKSKSRQPVWLLLAACAALGFAGCTRQDLQTQLAAGSRTFLNGMFNVFATSVTNSLFGLE